MQDSGNRKFIQLRNDYPLFIFEGFDYYFLNNRIEASFHFILDKKTHFKPSVTFKIAANEIYDNLSEDLIKNLIFNIGMTEMISYWKAACSPNILIKPYKLDEKKAEFWKKLFYLGLGEFFHTNGIKVLQDKLLNFSYANNAPSLPSNIAVELNNSNIIPIGGGKDSAVSIELLRKVNNINIALVVNQRGATKQVLKAGGFKEQDIFEIDRRLDPMIIKLNDEGFLNGHTPFSALLAFISSFGALLKGVSNVVLSNESSANEASVPGTKINHQYSKSYEFEKDFRDYFHQNISPSINYYSLLRPLNELQIGALFSKYEKYHKVFKSCNAGSKKDIWCCKCSKCLFTYIILSPFLKQSKMIEIFGEDLFNNESLIEYFDQLCGFADEKPFECVGTIDEVNAALKHVTQNYEEDLPLLLQRYAAKSNVSIDNIKILLSEFNNEHFLTRNLTNILKSETNAISL